MQGGVRTGLDTVPPGFATSQFLCPSTALPSPPPALLAALASFPGRLAPLSQLRGPCFPPSWSFLAPRRPLLCVAGCLSPVSHLGLHVLSEAPLLSPRKEPFSLLFALQGQVKLSLLSSFLHVAWFLSVPPCKHDEGGAPPPLLTLSSATQSKAGTWWVIHRCWVKA